MSDLISRQAALDGLKYEMKYGAEIDRCGLDTAYDIIENVTPAEPERHRGEWIEDGHERGFSECSKCGYIAVSVLTERLYNFCPNCGAEMRGE